MSSHKNPDLIISYVHKPAKPRTEAGTMISQTLPMAAMFMRNKLLSWASLFLALQSYLTEPINKPPTDKDAGSQPPLLRIFFALISLITCYMEFYFPGSSSLIKKGDYYVTTDVASTIASAAASTIASTFSSVVPETSF